MTTLQRRAIQAGALAVAVIAGLAELSYSAESSHSAFAQLPWYMALVAVVPGAPSYLEG